MHFPDAAAAAGTTGDAAIPDHFTNTVANSNTIANTGPHEAATSKKASPSLEKRWPLSPLRSNSTPIAVKVDTHGPSFAAVANCELAGTYQGDFARTADANAATTNICMQAERGSSSSSYSHPARGHGSAPHNERHGGDRDFQPRPTHNQNGKRQRQDYGKLPDNTGSRPL